MKQFRSVKLTYQRETFTTIFLILVAVLLFMPLFTTFNDVLTRIVINTGFYQWIKATIVPHQVRMVAVLLLPFGFQPRVIGEYLAIGRDEPFLIEIAWNCIGWQSMLFFVLTGWISLQGDHFTTLSKAKAWIIGFLGTFLVNLIRIAVVALLAYYFGQNVAIVFHDYGATLTSIAWLFFFWWFAHQFVLEEKVSSSMDKNVTFQ